MDDGLKIIIRNQERIIQELVKQTNKILEELKIIQDMIEPVEPEIETLEITEQEQKDFYNKLISTEKQAGNFGLSKEEIKKLRIDEL